MPVHSDTRKPAFIPYSQNPRIRELLTELKRERPSVYRHARRVAAYMDAIGKCQGLSPAARERWRTGAMLHDIGKLLIPKPLLLARGSLTPKERELMRAHVYAGLYLLEHRLDPALAREFGPFVFLHHERYDGTGYPLGLKGSELPFEIALLSVADAYAAMRECRPYCRPRAGCDALDELLACSGTQFHPQAVALFLKTLGVKPQKKRVPVGQT